jgi:uncharacterized protein (DUF488 family)
MTHPFFTIGHSTRPLTEFVELLRESEIQLVVDVRTVPRSRTNPQFNRDVLPLSLSEFAIAHRTTRRSPVPEPKRATLAERLLGKP